MKILIIYDGTKRTIDSLRSFAPDFDFDLLECEFAESDEEAKKWLEKKSFQQIIITGESIDLREVEKNDFIPYNIFLDLPKFILPETRILLVSPDADFLNKGEYVAQGKGLKIERHFVKNYEG